MSEDHGITEAEMTALKAGINAMRIVRCIQDIKDSDGISAATFAVEMFASTRGKWPTPPLLEVAFESILQGERELSEAKKEHEKALHDMIVSSR